ncbi:PI-PLC X domain-containing protein 2 [Plakobranchus ocellatus]|uniref:PI-PLC X domain-containing protein 2 n=1 Tax=Plakobranchus ocellatus TaxID=259542 RepID=A0AAV4DL25_9GAST|nr:PI-PLC X domain-containing protein 2 [Plakobranchus ocellatus]
MKRMYLEKTGTRMAAKGINKKADWMSNLPEVLKKQPLSSITMPGTHDTGAFCLDCRDKPAPDAPDFVNAVSWIPGVKKVLADWGITQSLNFQQQLEAGIRYFDLRVATYPDSRELYLVHTLYGPSVEDMLSDVDAFLNEHPGEIVLLDFNHFYDMDVSDHEALLTRLLTVFGSKLCAADYPVSDMSLDRMISQGKRVIVFYLSQVQVAVKTQVATRASILSPWANTPDAGQCMEFLEDTFACPPVADFVVCQGVLTPTVTTVLCNLCSSLHSLNLTLSPLLNQWLSSTPHHLSIVLADFVEETDFIDIVLARNHRSRAGKPYQNIL